MRLTSSQEEYLKTIYLLSDLHENIRVTDIANKLRISKPSVNRAIRVLNDIGLINYHTYGNITITDEGIKIAKVILKKFDIVKMFLTEVLGVSESKAKEDAKAIKSTISEETESRLQEYIIKVLKLEELECGYDIDNEKCRSCARSKIHGAIEMGGLNKC